MVSSAALSGAVFNIATPHLRATPIHRSVVPPFLRVLQFLSLSLALFLLLLSSTIKIREKKKEVQISRLFGETFLRRIPTNVRRAELNEFFLRRSQV